MKKIDFLLGQINDVISQGKSPESSEEVEFTPPMLTDTTEAKVHTIPADGPNPSGFPFRIYSEQKIRQQK